MTDLMIHVEKIVRPIHVNIKKKLKMREELLSHITGIYDEEFERLGNHEAAVNSAVERFGPSDKLSKDLQSSVPWNDMIVLLLGPFQLKWTWPHSVWSMTLWSWCLSIAIAVPLLCLLSRFFSGSWFSLEVVFVALAYTVGLLVGYLYLYGTAGALHGILKHPKSTRLAGLYSLGFFCFVTLGAMLLATGLTLSTSTLIYASLCTLGAAIASYGFGIMLQKEEQIFSRIREWELLDLDL